MQPPQVLYYNPKARRFESRVVKIDEQLSFLFVLQEGTLKEPFATRLYEVDEAQLTLASKPAWTFYT